MQLSLFEPSREVSRETSSFFYARIHEVVSFEDDGSCMLDVRALADDAPSVIKGRCAYAWPGLSFAAQVTNGEFAAIHFGEPPTPRALKKFLKSGAFGVFGKKTAEVLSRAFAGEFFAVLKREPSRLLAVEGIGRKRLDDILTRYRQFKERCSLSEFLFAENLPLSWSRFIERSALEHAPYEAVRAYDLDFALVDEFSLRRGFARDSHDRLSVGLESILRGAQLQGHCAFPDEQLLGEACERLGVSRDLIENELELALVQERFVVDEIESTPVIYTKHMYDLESAVAERLLSLAETAPTHAPLNPAKTIAWAQRFLDITLSEKQREAVQTAVSSSLSIITGGPGTGKTTLVRCLVTTLNSQFSRYALCAPTGRAAQRLKETTGAYATTIHRLLKFDGVKFAHDAARPLDLDFVLVDEASMIDLQLMSSLLEALPLGCALVLVGDANQLPSVGAGAVLRSVIDARKFPVIELNDTFRQSQDSGIRLNAARVHSGWMPVNTGLKKNDFKYIEAVNPLAQLEKILRETFPREYGITDLNRVQILTPTNKGEYGTTRLNEQLKHLFTKQQGKLNVGDKVIVSKNDYARGVFNGDIGRITRITHEIEIDFGDRVATFPSDEALQLAYAITIHKSQGSEYSAVVVLLTEEHASLAQRHLLYTAITRGKEAVFLLADPRTLKTALGKSEKRWQKLTERLR